MKRVFVVLFAAILLLTLAACGAKEEENSGEGSINPWKEAANAEAAAEGAGVGYFTVSENGTETSGGPIDILGFQYMKGIAEADGAIGTADLTIRKGLKQDSEDVSGDYTAYTYAWTQEVDGWEVYCLGNEDGKMTKAIWLSDNFSYSIVIRGQGDLAESYGVDADAVTALVSGIE